MPGPPGVTIQADMTSLTAADTVDVVVSVRDEDHLPVDDAPVDLFSAPLARPGVRVRREVHTGGDSRGRGPALRDRLRG